MQLKFVIAINRPALVITEQFKFFVQTIHSIKNHTMFSLHIKNTKQEQETLFHWPAVYLCLQLHEQDKFHFQVLKITNNLFLQ